MNTYSREKYAQTIATRILNDFLLNVKTIDDFNTVFDKVYKEYNLCIDPFTKCICTPEEYVQLKEEYDIQIEEMNMQ